MYIIRAYDEQSNGYFVQLNHLHKTIKTSPSASESYDALNAGIGALGSD